MILDDFDIFEIGQGTAQNRIPRFVTLTYMAFFGSDIAKPLHLLGNMGTGLGWFGMWQTGHLTWHVHFMSGVHRILF